MANKTRKPVRRRRWAFPIIPICASIAAFTLVLVPVIIMLAIGGNQAMPRFVIASCIGSNCTNPTITTYCNDTLAIVTNCINTGTLNQTLGTCTPIVIACDNSTSETVLYCNNTGDAFLCIDNVWIPFASQQPDSPKLFTFTRFGSSISGSTAQDPPNTLQYVYIERNGTFIPSDQTPVPVPFSALLTFVTFNGTIPQNQDIVRHVYYTNTVTQVEFQFQEQCFTLIGFDTLLCWTGTDYCYYPLQLGGLNGVVVNSLSEVASFVGPSFSVDPITGCWNRLVPYIAKKKKNAPVTTPIRTGRPNKYMIIGLTTGAAVANLPFLSTRNIDIDWGDGTIDVLTNHTYSTANSWVVRIAGTAHTLSYSAQPLEFRGNVNGVAQWGDVVTHTLNFHNEAFNLAATDGPNPSLVDISNLFDFVDGAELNTDAWILPNIESADRAFVGNYVSKVIFSLSLTSTSAMYLNAQLPAFDTTGMGFSSLVSSEMFRGTIFNGPVIFHGISLNGPVRAFFGASFQSSVTFTMCAMSGDATSAFEGTIFQATSNFNGLDMSTVTVSEATFKMANFVNNVPIMATLNANSSTNANEMFLGVNRVPDLPHLGLSAANSCTDTFKQSTIVEPFIPTWPTMKCTNAQAMFPSTHFSQGANFAQMFVGNIVNADAMFFDNTRVTGNFTSPGVFSSATSTAQVFRNLYCTSIGACPFPFDFDQLSFPVTLNAFGALAEIGFAVPGATTITNIPNLDLSQATECSLLFNRDVFAERFVPNWPNMKCTNAAGFMIDVTLTLGADFSNMNVTLIVDGDNALAKMIHNGLIPSVMPGPFTSMTNAPAIFDRSQFQVDADWSSVSIPIVTVAAGAFFTINRLGPLPALNPVSVTDGSLMFAFSTFTAPLQSHLWTFLALQSADSMFSGTDFGNFAFRTDTWGMGAIQSLQNTFNGANNVPSTIDVANWQVSNLISFSGFVFGVNNPALVIDLSAWNTPALLNMPSAFSNTLNVQFVGINNLNVAGVIDMTDIFFDANVNGNNITSWDTTNVIMANSAFERLVTNTLDVTGLNTPSLTFADTMFRNSNMNPNITNWNLASVTSASDILSFCYITKANYDEVLIGFESRSTLDNNVMGAPQLNPRISVTDNTDVPQFYSATAQTARSNLITRGWTISDGGLQ